MANDKLIINRRTALKTGLAGAAALATPTFFIRDAWADDFCNMPKGNDRHLRLQRAADRRLCRRRRGRAARLSARRQAPQWRGRRRHAQDHEAAGAEGQRHARQEGGLRHRRHPDQGRRGARHRQAHDREGRRHHDHRRLVVGRGGRRAVAVPGDGRHLHGRPDPLQRHHRQGQARLRLPPLLQRLHVGRRARPGARPKPTARTASPIT